MRSAARSGPEVLVTADDVRQGKPAPDGYLTAVARLATAPDECVVIEDTRPGVLASRAAGLPVIGVAGPELGAEEDVDLVIDSLDQLHLSFVDGVVRLRASARGQASVRDA